jgi:hypothetical protein
VKNTNKPLSNFALIVDDSRIDKTGEHGVWKLRFADISRGIDAMEYPDKFDATGRMFNGLTVYVQWTRSEHGKTYAWNFYYDGVDIENVDVAEAHLSMMRRIKKAREQMIVWPATFGQYITLVTRGIGVKTFVRRGERRDNPGWRSLSDHYYIPNNVDNYLSNVIDNEISKHYHPKPEAVDAA